MSFKQRIASWLGLKYDTLDLLRDMSMTRVTKTGISIDHATALKVATVLACARVVAEGVAQVPFGAFKKAGNSVQVLVGHPIVDLLNWRPNELQTWFNFFETIVFHLLLKGNAYVWMGKVGTQRELRELMILNPVKMTIEKTDKGKLIYKYNDGGKQFEFNSDVIWHIRSASWEPHVGMEPISLAAEAIGLSLALEESHSRLHKNGVKTSGVYSIEANLSPAKYKEIMAFLKDRMTGKVDEGLPLILDQNAKWLQQQMTGVDSQHIETRKHQIVELCAALRVMPIMIGHADKTMSYASVEQMSIMHVIHTLMPYYVRIEQSANINLFTEKELKTGYYFKFNPNGLMRGAAKDRADFYTKMVGSVNATPGIMTINEIRALEELPPIAGGNELFKPDPAVKPEPKKPSSENPDDDPEEEEEEEDNG